ncbi:MAG: hypothetical protein C4516_00205 [Oxalobacter sp.]|jgi:hypothetical protein|nr:MAG: hypothetical protein C4516_00205 [Oxalobacter sp.]
MTVELFSPWGLQKGRLSARADGYQISAVLGEYGIWYTGKDVKQLEQAFHRACRRAILRRLLPFLTPPPGRLAV